MFVTISTIISGHFILSISNDFLAVTVHSLTAADIDLVAAAGDSVTVSFCILIDVFFRVFTKCFY